MVGQEPLMDPTIEYTMQQVAIAHRGQVDRSDKPYVLHLMRVASRFIDPFLVTVALLHDIVEDTWVTLDQLREWGYSQEVVEAVAILTRTEPDDYAVYIERVADDETASRVKMADINDHLTRWRDGHLSESHVMRYQRAFKRLSGEWHITYPEWRGG